jgi:tRNA (Thr-GGU) A37 N-methylase
VKLLRIDGGRIFVSGLDLFNGTPILDIKPYRGDYRVEQYALAGWYQKLRDKAGSDI